MRRSLVADSTVYIRVFFACFALAVWTKITSVMLIIRISRSVSQVLRVLEDADIFSDVCRLPRNTNLLWNVDHADDGDDVLYSALDCVDCPV